MPAQPFGFDGFGGMGFSLEDLPESKDTMMHPSAKIISPKNQ